MAEEEEVGEEVGSSQSPLSAVERDGDDDARKSAEALRNMMMMGQNEFSSEAAKGSNSSGGVAPPPGLSSEVEESSSVTRRASSVLPGEGLEPFEGPANVLVWRQRELLIQLLRRDILLHTATRREEPQSEEGGEEDLKEPTWSEGVVFEQLHPHGPHGVGGDQAEG